MTFGSWSGVDMVIRTRPASEGRLSTVIQCRLREERTVCNEREESDGKDSGVFSDKYPLNSGSRLKRDKGAQCIRSISHTANDGTKAIRRSIFRRKPFCLATLFTNLI